MPVLNVDLTVYHWNSYMHYAYTPGKEVWWKIKFGNNWWREAAGVFLTQRFLQFKNGTIKLLMVHLYNYKWYICTQHNTLWCNEIGTVGKLTIFKSLQLMNSTFKQVLNKNYFCFTRLQTSKNFQNKDKIISSEVIASRKE